MKTIVYCIILLFISFNTHSQNTPPKNKILTLGVFHFAYPNLDVIKTSKKNQISVLDEPYKSEIIAICNELKNFKPTIIAVEAPPSEQNKLDSLYKLYLNNKLKLGKNETFQLGFRIAKLLNLKNVICIDNEGKHYKSLNSLFKDTNRLKKFSNYYKKAINNEYRNKHKNDKIKSIINCFIKKNTPENIKKDLANYLIHPFKYEENKGDFTGVDFESGRWFNRNLRIFRNIQRISETHKERILLIIGSGHLNILNFLFDSSNEFDLISPLHYLNKAKNLHSNI